MSDSAKQLGQRIRELRKQKKLTQEQLGEASNVGGKYISQVEREGANLTLTVAENIANGLGVDLQILFDFGHHTTDKQLKDELKAIIDKTEGDNLRAIHRMIRAILS